MNDQAAVLTARNATLEDLAGILTGQHARKLDVVAPATSLRFDGGRLRVYGIEAVMDEQGVTPVDGIYVPTDVFDDGLSEKLQIPRRYVRRCRAERPELLDRNVNEWLHGGDEYAPDGRSFLVRLFRGGDGGPGVARAMLSDSFRLGMDNLDVLTGVLEGVRQASADVSVVSCDLTERRMRVRVAAPGVAALAPYLLNGYRTPFDDPEVKRAGGWQNGGWTLDRARRAAAAHGGQGYEPGKEPVVFAGFDFGNSENGNGAFFMDPVLIVQVCANGLRLEAQGLRRVHVGGRLDDGIVRPSADTVRKALELVTAQTRDAVATYLDVDYVQAQVTKLEEKAGAPVKDAAAVVETVTNGLKFSDAERASVLDHFIRGGQMTAGGIMQAITSVAQTIEDPDRAYDLEGCAVQAMEMAAKL